ncbi:hypothetical protein QFZ40_003734 [Arthrobacter pascens]|nr:hypothetical protein [Arthrobacter pascens]
MPQNGPFVNRLRTYSTHRYGAARRGTLRLAGAEQPLLYLYH